MAVKQFSGSRLLLNDVNNEIVGVRNGEGFPHMFPRVIATSAVAQQRASANAAGDATFGALASILIPAYSLGKNGFLRIDYTARTTNSANVKSTRILLGSTVLSAVTMTNNNAVRLQMVVQNRDSYAAQVCSLHQTSTSHSGPTTNDPYTATVDTTVDQWLYIGGQWAGATASESIYLDRYHVEAVYAD